MFHYRSKCIGEGVYVLTEENICIYVVCGSRYAAVIDTGYGSGNLPQAVAMLTPLPQIVILTHGHPDHFLGAYHYPEVYLNLADTDVFARYSTEGFVTSNYRDLGISCTPTQGLRAPSLLPMPSCFDLGGRTLEVVSLRGHTPGSVGLLLREEKILFSGDGLTYCVWMQLEESTTLEEYRTMLLSLLQRKGDFNLILNGHSFEPAPTAHLEHVIALTTKVLEEQPGSWLDQEEFSGILAQGEGCQIIYRKEKLFLPK